VSTQKLQTTRHEGKIVLITGGTSGIGLATAQRLALEGAAVVVTGRRQQELDAAVRKIGRSAFGVRGDIASLEDLDVLVTAIKQRHGRLDILFANAGTGELLPLGAITEAHVDRIFGVNVKGTLFTVQKVLPLMSRGGAIVINGSMAASKGMPAFSVYAASKAALRAFARGWSVELRDRGVRVNVVAPGTIITPGYRSAGLSDEQIEGFKALASAAAALGRTGTEDEVAAAVSFLASNDSSYITGIELFVDGGTAQI
jgi:NAD(P)-dependent dehydrogenase (short-subunit alcohol dehydrogenase family)